MSQTGQDRLVEAMAIVVLAQFAEAEAGDCQRVDDVPEDLAQPLAAAVSGGAVEVYVLRETPTHSNEIKAERAIELRNRKVAPLLLLVPSGEGHAASSLDNSFQRTSTHDVFVQVESELRRELGESTLGDHISRNLSRLRTRQAEWWAEFLAELCADSSEQAFGLNLWRIGLVPDSGPSPWTRLGANRHATRSIAQPSRPTASLDERFTVGGLREGPWRAGLRAFCDALPASLADARAWCRIIAEERPDLTFEKWLLAEAVEEDIDALQLEPFLRSDGKIDAGSKLKQGEDGQLTLQIPDGGTAPLVVKWKTDPPKVAAIYRWSLEILPPDDMRDESSEPLVSTFVKGDKRRCTLNVSVDEDALSMGSRFVVVLTALGPNGEVIGLKSGDPATADSQEFQVVSSAEPETRTRRAAASSLPEARLKAALDGMDDLSEDLVSWDMAGQVFGLRLGNRRAVQIRISTLLIDLQRLITAAPQVAQRFSAVAPHGLAVTAASLTGEAVVLPERLRKVRADFLSALARRRPRDTVESVQWDDELRGLASTYLATFRRALDNADDASAMDILGFDSLSLTIKKREGHIRGVVLLPLHPIRLAWMAEYDSVLGEWAQALTEVLPRGRRGTMVDVGLVARVLPANLPFSLPHSDGDLAYYAEEVTFGSGLYLVPGTLDSDAALESVASVVGVPRGPSSLAASSQMVGERIRGYEKSHEPGETLRVLSVRPGSGELLAGALRNRFEVSTDDDDSKDPEDPRRLEVYCYTDEAGFAKPVPALMSVQSSLRLREFARKSSHLFPPLSLSVRPTNQLLEHRTDAHVAVVQDVAVPGASYCSSVERAPSFHDLVVPLVTHSINIEGGVTWQSVPATGVRTNVAMSELTATHGSHQRAVARVAGMPADQVPSIQVFLDGDRLAQLKSAHERADWVIGVDRFIGTDLYEGGASHHMAGSYILDYAPDFVEGLGERLTVTTNKRGEVEGLLALAMKELHLETVDESVGQVLSMLSVVSGRLALRLLANSTQAKEAVSLAAVVSHLQRRGELDGLIVIPVDAHPEVFGAASRAEDSGTRRCDLLLVRITQRSFKIECVEVKSRQESRVAQALVDRIIEQLQDTQRVLEALFFANDPPRIDRELQAARLASLLHFYAERSMMQGLIDPSRREDVHRLIDKIEENGEVPDISLKGYVISLEGDQGFKKKYGDVSITVLTAEDLGQIGLTTRRIQQDPTSEEFPPGSDSAPSDGGGGGFGEDNPAPDPSSADMPATPDPEEESPGEEPGEPHTSGGQEGGPDGAPSGDPPAEVVKTVSEALEPTSVSVILGHVESGADVTLRVSTQGSPHAFIIGIPGQGKSVTTRKIIRDFAQQGLPSLVFDFHGDMAANPPPDSDVLDAALGLPFNPLEPDVGAGRPINVTAWEIAEVIGFVSGLGDIQRNHVYKALVDSYLEHGWEGTTLGREAPSLSEFAAAVESVETGAKGKNARDRLRPFTDFGLFDDSATERFQVLRPGRGLIIDVSRIGLEEVQRFAASFILRRIYREMFTWGQSGQLRLAVILDEAHRLARDVTLPKIMKEGRKYGVAVVVASQSAEDFHADVLGNAGTKIVFRTNFPASKSVAGFLRGRTGVDLSEQIERLGVGVAFVATPDDATARKVYMNE